MGIAKQNWRVLLPALLLPALIPQLVGAQPPTSSGRGAPDEAEGVRAASSYRPLPRTDTLIRDVTLLDGAGRRIERADILIREGRIAEVGSGLVAPAGVAAIDGTGRWVTPGIIDVHSHNGTFVAPLTASDGEAPDVTEVSSPIAAGTWIEDAVNTQDPAFGRALEGGVTTLQILPGSIPLIGGRTVVLKNVPANDVQAMKFPDAPQGVKMSCGDNPRHYFGSRGREPNSRQGSLEVLRGLFGHERHEQAEREERGEPGRRGRRGPNNEDSRTIGGILSGELRVHVHCYRAEDMAVMTDLAREYGFRITAFHHATEAYKAPELFRANGTCAVVWSDWWGFKTEAADAIRANAAFVDATGACVALHSDSPIMGQRLNLEAAKAMAAGRRAGIAVAPEHAIRWITSNPARVLGLEDRIGTVEVGRNADLVLWSGDPFSVYSRAERVFIDGAIVFDRNDPRRRPRSDFELGRPAAAPRP